MLLPKYFSKSILGLFLLLLILPLGGVKGETDTASDYYFSVPQEIVEIWINTDGSADIEYWITFTVEGGGDPIDIVDIGFPNKHYDLGSIKADVDGHPIIRF